MCLAVLSRAESSLGGWMIDKYKLSLTKMRRDFGQNSLDKSGKHDKYGKNSTTRVSETIHSTSWLEHREKGKEAQRNNEQERKTDFHLSGLSSSGLSSVSERRIQLLVY